ncbi:aldehyde dehydrogenase family protein, partial [Pseudomonadales bacterium]|nr:aldehyde dehydrogenase family protein [Pseudomonadales bacterium]
FKSLGCERSKSMQIPGRIGSLIGGVEVFSEDRKEVVSPHSGERLTTLCMATNKEMNLAIDEAAHVADKWGSLSSIERSDILYKTSELLERDILSLSEIVSKEAGKSVAQAKSEIVAAIRSARFFAGEGARLFGRTLPSIEANKHIFCIRQPCGVAGLITAFNTPAPNFAWKVFPALVCGNSVVLKPSEHTPISAHLMAKLMMEAGLPEGVLNVVQGDGRAIVSDLFQRNEVGVVSFTGSTSVGRELGVLAGASNKKLSLELGGKNAIYIHKDADIPLAVQWVVQSAFSNAGQRCASASRCIIAEGIYTEFVDSLITQTEKIAIGVGDSDLVGPLISEIHVERVLDKIGKAITNGANILVGGRRASSKMLSKGNYLEPTIVEGLPEDSEMAQEELFAPILALYKAGSEDEAIRLVNNSSYGLSAAVHTKDINFAMKFARCVETGVVNINGGTHGSEPHVPFGGLKNSGNGTREPGTEAIDIYTNLKNICIVEH